MKRSYNLMAYLAISVILLGIGSSASAGRIIYIDADANGLNDGSSWTDAYGYSQDAPVDANSGALEEAADTELPDYVENEIIVKFQGGAADAIEMELGQGLSAGELQLSDSLARLNRKYKLKKAEGLFKGFAENRQRLKNLLQRDEAVLTTKEKRILGRLKRAASSASVPDLSRIYKLELELEAGQSVEEVVEAYNNDLDVEYAELNYFVYAARAPNDPEYSEQWGPEKIDAPGAWDVSTGSSEIIVAVIDTGVDYTHRDIVNNMWVNSGEIGDNGVDDDGNGYVDDIYGYDFVNNDNDPDDDAGHGTHCAGIVGAQGDNGLDIAGICWDVRIMALKFLGSDGRGTTADAVSAFYYAVENGADITSNSWGGGAYAEVMRDALAYAHSQGVINVASAGNDDCNCPQYPANYEDVIAVAATALDDLKASFSNYGNWVDIAAPGVGILSLRPGNRTTSKSGTSMACPHVAGSCALLLSANPFVPSEEIYDILTETADPIEPWICQSGRLNLFNAMRASVSPEGRISLDADYYSCAALIPVVLADSDLAGQGSHGVELAASGGDWEALVLAEAIAGVGVFAGAISTGSEDVNIGDGILQISHGELIIASYEDANDGSGQAGTATDTALADCQGPLIFNIEIDGRGPQPTVRFETDEPTTGRVLCGLACEIDHIIQGKDLRLATSHTVKLTGVSPETDYFIIVGATDVVGNETVDDNGGNCYPFTTDGPSDVHVPGQYATIQEAIDHCWGWEGGTVWVADGTYAGPGNRDIDFYGKAITVRSEDGPENCIIDCEKLGRGFYFHSGEDANSILTGFTIKNGYAAYGGGIRCKRSSPKITNCIISGNTAAGDDGGGMYNRESSPTVTNCVFRGNWAMWFGGGMNNYESDPTVTNCMFIGNTAQSDGGGVNNDYGSPELISCAFVDNVAMADMYDGGGGGGVYNYRSNPMLVDCVFNRNMASGEYMGMGEGGGMYNNGGSVTLTGCVFTQNSALVGGGGILDYAEAMTLTDCVFNGNSTRWENGGGITTYRIATLSNCTFVGNSAGDGGGIYARYNLLSLSNCVFRDNIAEDEGGAVFCTRTEYDALENCVFSGNSAGETGGGLYSDDSNATLVNCTFADNSAANGNAVACDSYRARSDLRLANCIVWGGDDEIWNNDASDIHVTYSDVQGGWPGEGNIDADPVFALEGDYHLLSSSPCIDAGTNGPPYAVPPADLDGNPRPLDGDGNGTAVADMGAYEYNPAAATIVIYPVAITHTVLQDGSNPEANTISLVNAGGAALNWELTTDCQFVYASPVAGELTCGVADEVEITVEAAGLSRGTHTCVLTISDPEAVNSPRTVTVTLHIPGTIKIPQDFATIQQAIDAAINGDVIEVADGVYTGPGNKDLDFRGKLITVRSENGPANCIIDCEGHGRGFWLHRQESDKAKVEGFTIRNGLTRYSGGAIRCHRSSPTITNCILIDNSAYRGEGGGIYCYDGSPTIANCIVIGNSAQYDGGGIHCYWSDATITNCAITGNTCGWRGGGVCCYWSDATITNCTITGNTCGLYGGGVCCYWSDVTIMNCILWADRGADGSEIALRGSWFGPCTLGVSYCNILGGQAAAYLEDDPTLNWGEGNIDADPCFIEPGYWDSNGTPSDVNDDFWVDGDYHLLLASPCIDAGHPNYPLDPNETDIDGQPRVIGVRVDMGADESAIEVQMKFTPQAVNPGSQVKWFKLHFVLPEGSGVEDVDVNNPALCRLMGMDGVAESNDMNVFVNKEDLVEIEAFFDRGAFSLCRSRQPERNVTVLGMLSGTAGQYFYGTDTIKIINKTWAHLASFASRWLEEGCGESDWCGGIDLNQDGTVNFADFALLDGCCIEVVK